MLRLAEAQEVVIGNEYLVPSIDGRLIFQSPDSNGYYDPDKSLSLLSLTGEKFIPVCGTPHNDSKYKFGEELHIHLEFRFLQPSIYCSYNSWTRRDSAPEGYAPGPPSILRYPGYLNQSKGLRIKERPFTCLRKHIEYPIRQCAFMLCNLQDHFRNKKIDPNRPVCPHRGALLNGTLKNGKMICPNHGLCWAKNGTMVHRNLPSYTYLPE